MPYFTYVIYSKKFNRLYKGHCEDLEKRIEQHNRGETNSTKPYVPWTVIYFEQFKSRESAIEREKYFKTAAGRRFLKKNLVLPNQ